jgi:NAD(P)-dependent dehydrogenase (short-subunit alcohol dehydrogenase family)
MRGKTVLVTGANSGIGLATAGQLGQRGARVVITARDLDRGQAAVTAIRERYGVEVELGLLDLASFGSIQRFAADFLRDQPALHVLINNAGLAISERRETENGFEYTWGVNYLGSVLLTDLLLERLKASAPSRVVYLSSAAHVGARKGLDFDDLDRRRKYDGQAYCQAKLALIYYARAQARQLAEAGVSVFSVNPGFVATRFGQDGDMKGFMAWFFRLGKHWMADPDRGARGSVFAASEPGLEAESGAYIDRGRVARPSSVAQDDAAIPRLLEITEAALDRARQLVGAPTESPLASSE